LCRLSQALLVSSCTDAELKRPGHPLIGEGISQFRVAAPDFSPMNLGRFRAAQMCLVDDVNLQNPPSARRRRNPAELPSVEVPAHALGKRFRPTHASPSRTGGDRYSGANELNRSE